MPCRSIVFAATVIAGLAFGSDALAQQAPAPGSSASPEATPSAPSMPSAAPSGDTAPVATAEPTAMPLDEASPSPPPHPPASLAGTLLSLKGTIATVKMANGSVQAYTVTAKTAALLKKSVGKKVAFRLVHGVLNLLPH
jgi:hypothetical protein